MPGKEIKIQEIQFANAILLPEIVKMLNEGHTVTLRLKGFSMRPFLEFGRDKVKLAFASSFHVGDAVLAEIAKGHYVLHRIIKKEGDRVTLQGDGNVRGVEQCTTADIKGVVTEYIRPNRILFADDVCLKQKIRLWQKLRPIRRYLLFIYKALI